MDMKARVALVTGSSRGIGRAIALKLASSGAKIGIHCLKNNDLAETVADEIRSAGGEAFVVQGDIALPDVAESIVNQVHAAYRRLDVLINNAAMVSDAPAPGLTDDEWQRVIDVNLTGTFNVCRAAARHMMQQRYGRIINISSFVANYGSRGQANYVASKGGVEALTRALAVELAPRKITVNAVAPGAIETDMSREVIDSYNNQLLSCIPLKRLGKPEDVASLVAYLASEEAGYITGECIGITGGLGLWNPHL